MGQLSDLLKAAIGPTDVSVGGVLRPEAAMAFIGLVVDQSAFLKRITVEQMGKMTKDLSALDIAARMLVRVAQGNDPSSGQLSAPTQKGKTLTALNAQLFAQVTFDAISDNANDPGFEDRLAAQFALAIGNDLTDLGTNGTADDYAGSAFLALNKGWVYLAKNATNSVKIDVNTLADDFIGNLTNIVKAQQNRWMATSVLVMSPKSYKGLVDDVGSEPGGISLLLSGSIPGFQGNEIVQNPYMPDDTVIFTPLSNFVFGVNRDIQRYREIRGTKRCIDYTFDVACDFEFLVDDAVVIGYNVP